MSQQLLDAMDRSLNDAAATVSQVLEATSDEYCRDSVFRAITLCCAMARQANTLTSVKYLSGSADECSPADFAYLANERITLLEHVLLGGSNEKQRPAGPDEEVSGDRV